MRRALAALAAAGAVAALVVLAWHSAHRASSRRAALDVDGAAPSGGLTLAGRVTDLRGRPLAGARVVARPEVAADGGGATVGGATVGGATVGGTDDDGRFALRLAAGRWRLLVEADGHEPAELRGVEPPDDALEVALARRMGLDGVVRIAGQPAVGAVVEAGGPVQATATVDAGGRFVLAHLVEGRYALRVRSADGQAAAYREPIAVGEEVDGGARPLELSLTSALAVRGWLRDRGGRAIDGGEVTLVEHALSPLPRRVRSARNGSFTFVAVLPGSYLLSARADEFVTAEAQTERIPAAGPLELRLERGASVEGAVVDGDGHPVAGATIEVAGESGGSPLAIGAEGIVDLHAGRLEPSGELGVLRGPIPYPPSVPRAPGQSAARAPVSDGQGRFRVVGLPGGRLVVVASHPDFARAASEPFTSVAGASTTVQIVLLRGITLRGRVVDDRDQPLAGAEILDGDGRTQTFSDAHGEFALAHLTRAQSLTARHAGYVPAVHPVRLDDSAPVELRLARAEGRLDGVVVDDRGFPVAGARVELSAPSDRQPHTLTSDGSGRFRGEALGPGPYRLRVAHADFVTVELANLAAGDEARVQLAPGGGLDGELRDARTGEVPAGAQVTISTGARTVTPPLVRGRFTTTGLEAGPATVRAQAPGYAPWSRAVEIPPGDRPHDVTLRDLRIELERGGVVLGEVRDSDGDPAAGAEVFAGPAHARADARGQFRLDGIAAGRVHVRTEQGGQHAADDVEVRADEETRVELHLR